MAAKRGKSQARRNTGTASGLPGWAWLVLGVVLTLGVVLMAPKFIKSGGGDGFFRPRPNPDARPAVASSDEDGIGGDADADTGDAGATPAKPKPQYDFYKMLPGDEVQMSDAELAATEREEAARKAQATASTAKPAATQPAAVADAMPAQADAGAQAGVVATPDSAPADGAHGAAATRPLPSAPYILQAGAFGASGDAEAIKAKVALLGLGARVESATIHGKTVYRVRMGPYATASELAEAKRKLADGGLPAMAIKAR